ncbi:hypothetical protein FACS18942_10260 [Planctomycetales bacterium]|nr:hypothetical protein FACS18942_10260 [Planctomycetales bacterium]
MGSGAVPCRADVVAPGTTQLLGIAAEFNDVFFGDFYGKNGDIEGHAAIQGNVTAIDYGFGGGEMAKHQGETVLVVGGNVNAKGTGVYDDNAYIKGTLTGINTDGTKNSGQWNSMHATDKVVAQYNQENLNYKAATGTVFAAEIADGAGRYDYHPHQELDAAQHHSFTTAADVDLLFDFAVAKEQLTRTSADLAALQSTVSGTFDSSNNYIIDLTGLSGLQVVDIDAQVFQTIGNLIGSNLYINTDLNADLTLLINITNQNALEDLYLRREFVINGQGGESSGIEHINGSFDGSNILINTDMSHITIENTAINASLLALDAEVYIQHGNINGQTFAGSGYTENGGEFHAYYTFDDKHLTTNATPEPATMLIFGLGALAASAFTAARRRMRK